MKFNKKHLVLSLILIGVLFSCRGNTHGLKEEIEIVWIGHSCFEVGFHEYRILIDPFLLACGDKNEFISERQDKERNIRGK